MRSNILAMSGYVPGEQLNDTEIVKLNTNENPYPPSPRVFESIQAALTGDKLRKYPEPLGDTFRKAASKTIGIDPDSILIGNGSDDLLTILTRSFVPEGGRIVSPTPSYLLYRTLSQIQGAIFETIRFTNDWQLPDPWPTKQADLVFLPNPNSPSGTAIALSEIVRIAKSIDSTLVLDEAYADFCDWNGLALVAELPNIVVTRSLSKAYSLAGIRFGFAVARPELVRELNKVKDSYNCDVLSLAAATAAIQDQGYFLEIREKIRSTRARMAIELTRLGFDVTPSHANFLWCQRSDRPLKPLYEKLKERKILLRYMNYDGYDGLRISVGTDREIDQLLRALSAIL